MRTIDPKQINNARIGDHVMTDIIPAFNKLVEEVNRIARQCEACQKSAPPKKADRTYRLAGTGVPYEELLEGAGFNTLDEVRSANLTSTKGIGPKRAKEINEWLEANA